MSTSTKPIIICQGAQYGSEAKGMVAAALCTRRKVDYAVRTGTVNAGHTVYKDGKKYVNQQLPTGWVNNGTDLVIGPGAYIHPQIFLDELVMVHEAGYTGRIYVDYRAGLHLPEHTDAAQRSGSHYRIGATGKGCSHAIISRIRRNSESMLFKEYFGESSAGWEWADTADLLNRAYDRGQQILLEGTQGTLLDLYLGPYPYATHKQCTAAQWVTEAGLSPSLEYEVVLVARTYPIRVAGNSGPMVNEIDWPTLAREINAKSPQDEDLVNPSAIGEFEHQWSKLAGTYSSENVEKSERNRDAWLNCNDWVRNECSKLFEFTTVTKKLRRIARLDLESLKYSVMLNRPKFICLTFLNYELPELWGHTGISIRPESPEQQYISMIEGATGCPVNAVTTGPEAHHFIAR